MFVIAAMLEFAGILFLQRRIESKTGGKVSTKGHLKRRGSLEMKKLWTAIDGTALILFLFAYLIFNAVYWIPTITQY